MNRQRRGVAKNLVKNVDKVKIIVIVLLLGATAYCGTATGAGAAYINLVCQSPAQHPALKSNQKVMISSWSRLVLDSAAMSRITFCNERKSILWVFTFLYPKEN